MLYPHKLEQIAYSDLKDLSYEVAVLPIGATEPHGMHLPYGTDFLTGAEIADWWLARSEARLLVEGPPHQLSLRLLTPASPALSGAWIDVSLGPDSELRPFVDGRPLAWAPTEWGIRFPIEELTTGETGEIQLLIPPGDQAGPDSDASGLSLP